VPLLALLGVTLIMCVAWSLVTPAFQVPDENSHFGYAQQLAEAFELPGDAHKPIFSTEQTLAASASNADQAAAVPATKMEWSELAYSRWRAAEHRLPTRDRDDGGGVNPASSNPPLYYLVAVPAYRVAEGGDIFTRLEAVRLWSIVWALVTVVGVWLLAGEVFDRRRLLQLAAAGFAALAPMVQFISAAVTPDGMLFAVWSIALWLGVRVLKRGLTARSCAALFLVVGAACVVKATSYALLPGAVFVLAVGLWRRRPLGARHLASLGAALAALLVTVGGWIYVAGRLGRPAAAQVTESTASVQAAGTNIRELLSYLWQFYLPRLPFQTPFRSGDGLPAYEVWFKGSWGAFGWLEVNFPPAVYLLLLALTVVVIALAIPSMWRTRKTSDLAVGAFLVLVAVSLVGGLHWEEYHLFKTGHGNFNQGRYLLPLVGLAGLLVAQAVRGLRADHRALAIAGTLGGLFALDAFSLALMLERFYA